MQPGHWTLGFLTNNVWSVTGSSHRPEVNQLLFQYFITYNLKKGWNINSGPIITANWNNKANGDASDGDDTTPGGRWTIPFGGGVGRIMRLGFQPVNISANFYGNAVHPPGASSWGMRLQIALLFPKKRTQEAVAQETQTVASRETACALSVSRANHPAHYSADQQSISFPSPPASSRPANPVPHSLQGWPCSA